MTWRCEHGVDVHAPGVVCVVCTPPEPEATAETTRTSIVAYLRKQAFALDAESAKERRERRYDQDRDERRAHQSAMLMEAARDIENEKDLEP